MLKMIKNSIYISKYHKPSTATNLNKKRNFSKNSVEDQYQPSSVYNDRNRFEKKNDGQRRYGQLAYLKYGHSAQAKDNIDQEEVQLKELDEKIQDISEIELDPEDNKESQYVYKIKPQTSTKQEIYDLLEKAKSTNWIDRVNAFEQLSNYVGNKASTLPNFTIFEKIIQTHFDHLNDMHFKVILVVQESFGKLIHSFSETLEPYLGEIIPRLLVNLSDKKETVNKSANLLLSSLNQRYGGDKLIKYFISVLDIKEDIIVIGASLEVLSHHLIKSSGDYFAEKSNLKRLIKRIGSVTVEYSDNESITMPALGVLLALRDLQMHKTIKCILGLPVNQLDVIQTLSNSFAPDLASNLSTNDTPDISPLGSTKTFPKIEHRLGQVEGSKFAGEESSGVPFFSEYDQIMPDEDNNTIYPSNAIKQVSTLGFPDSKTVYTVNDIDIIVENLRHSIDSRIDCMNHLQRLIQLCIRDSPSQRVAIKNRTIWKENNTRILEALYEGLDEEYTERFALVLFKEMIEYDPELFAEYLREFIHTLVERYSDDMQI